MPQNKIYIYNFSAKHFHLHCGTKTCIVVIMKFYVFSMLTYDPADNGQTTKTYSICQARPLSCRRPEHEAGRANINQNERKWNTHTHIQVFVLIVRLCVYLAGRAMLSKDVYNYSYSYCAERCKLSEYAVSFTFINS